jgi:hypothetical protein
MVTTDIKIDPLLSSNVSQATPPNVCTGERVCSHNVTSFTHCIPAWTYLPKLKIT